MRFMDDESIAGPKDFAAGNYLVQMVSFLRLKNSYSHGQNVKVVLFGDRHFVVVQFGHFEFFVAVFFFKGKKISGDLKELETIISVRCCLRGFLPYYSLWFSYWKSVVTVTYSSKHAFARRYMHMHLIHSLRKTNAFCLYFLSIGNLQSRAAWWNVLSRL